VRAAILTNESSDPPIVSTAGAPWRGPIPMAENAMLSPEKKYLPEPQQELIAHPRLARSRTHAARSDKRPRDRKLYGDNCGGTMKATEPLDNLTRSWREV
jgi:hypothetical protein